MVRRPTTIAAGLWLALWLSVPGTAAADSVCEWGVSSVKVQANVSFADGGARITAEGRALLDEVAKCLEVVPPGTRVQVVGHSDNRGSEESRLRMSEKRAQSVARYLKKRGVPKDVLVISGVGHLEPLETNRTPAGRAQNRRVEIRNAQPASAKETNQANVAKPATVPPEPGAGGKPAVTGLVAGLASPVPADEKKNAGPPDRPGPSAKSAKPGKSDAKVAGREVEGPRENEFEPAPTAPDGKGWRMLDRYAHWGTLAGAVVVAGVGGLYALGARNDRNAMDEQVRGNRNWRILRDSARRKARIADGLWGVGLAAGAASAWLFYRYYRADRPPATQLGVAPLPGGAAATIQGRL